MAKVTCGMPDGIVKERLGRACVKSSYAPYGFDATRPTKVLGFNGQPRDWVAGYYLLGAGYRAFSPALLRFNSPDSWSPFGEGGWNSYAYVSCDPVNFCDPTGHMKYSQKAPRQLVKRPDSLAVRPQKHNPPVESARSSSRSSSGTSSSTASPTPSTESLGISPLSERYSSQSSVFSSTSSGQDLGWTLDKSNVNFKEFVLTKAEQKSFDSFQNAIHNDGVSPRDAAKRMGDANYKLLQKKTNLYQIRLSGGKRVTFTIEDKRAIIRQVGGHT
ncbi:RHS repeat-associated core domain-containing protein [Pseudomonas sp. NPDC090592]|uniref:RHS repeat-associated core domain-containing protein n=1 Tax=Pseudomonas sp. NPDC090592 TaxID=3364480 RepID=UPI00383BAF78